MRRAFGESVFEEEMWEGLNEEQEEAPGFCSWREREDSVHVDMKTLCYLAGEEQAGRKQQLASVQKQSEALQKAKNSSKRMIIFMCAGQTCSSSTWCHCFIGAFGRTQNTRVEVHFSLLCSVYLDSKDFEAKGFNEGFWVFSRIKWQAI